MQCRQLLVDSTLGSSDADATTSSLLSAVPMNTTEPAAAVNNINGSCYYCSGVSLVLIAVTLLSVAILLISVFISN